MHTISYDLSVNDILYLQIFKYGCNDAKDILNIHTILGSNENIAKLLFVIWIVSNEIRSMFAKFIKD